MGVVFLLHISIMNRKILCHYCPECKFATNNKFCRFCGRLCYIYTGKGRVGPNVSYVSRSRIKASGDHRFYCKVCKVGQMKHKCPIHETTNLRLYNGYYLPNSTVSNLSKDRICCKSDMKQAVEICSRFVNTGISDTCIRGAIWKCRKCMKAVSGTSHCEGSTGPFDTDDRVCIVCRKIVDARKHCERYTKIVSGGKLVPDPRCFPIHKLNYVQYMGKYYCPVCETGGNEFVCICGCFASYRWYKNDMDSGYVLIPDLVDYESELG